VKTTVFKALWSQVLIAMLSRVAAGLLLSLTGAGFFRKQPPIMWGRGSPFRAIFFVHGQNERRSFFCFHSFLLTQVL